MMRGKRKGRTSGKRKTAKENERGRETEIGRERGKKGMGLVGERANGIRKNEGNIIPVRPVTLNYHGPHELSSGQFLFIVSQQVNLCIKCNVGRIRRSRRINSNEVFGASPAMRIQWILRVEWRLVNTSPEDDKRGQLISSLRSRPKSFQDQSGGAVKVGTREERPGQTEVVKGEGGWRGKSGSVRGESWPTALYAADAARIRNRVGTPHVRGQTPARRGARNFEENSNVPPTRLEEVQGPPDIYLPLKAERDRLETILTGRRSSPPTPDGPLHSSFFVAVAEQGGETCMTHETNLLFHMFNPMVGMSSHRVPNFGMVEHQDHLK
ncbi:hypothetical protein WN48_10933 [Eufriesea mexicana]|uniref:Uncharacterized protein n=1 Tax=Eufriesea mexicana TaxID=516756 RepID=A0A310S612_9HYME|nr:hypothetical protein WN48_10933 [Eufriesea mexicana]